MFLIVGLGNPGEKYEHTRHNVGFDVITMLSEKLQIPINHRKCDSMIGEGQALGGKVVLCKPQTYMNLSGEAVRQLLRWYKLPPENMMVIYDDIDLPFGWLRIRPNGSAGTHNGMRSIVDCINSEAFPRIRVGTGGKPPEYDLADWVLSHYNTPEERQIAFDAYRNATDATIAWMRSGVTAAMNQYNTRKPKPPKAPKRTQTSSESKASGPSAQEATQPDTQEPSGVTE